MKNILLFLLLTSLPCCLSAQEDYKQVRLVEFELGAGFAKGHKIDGAPASLGLQLFAETRLNIPQSTFDVGLQGMLSGLYRKENSHGVEHSIVCKGALVTFVDYNFRRWRRVSLFGGIGIGIAMVDDEYSWDAPLGGRERDTAFDRSLVLNPRIGVEFFNHLRLTVEYKMMKRDYSYFGLNIGGVFGGGRKRK